MRLKIMTSSVHTFLLALFCTTMLMTSTLQAADKKDKEKEKKEEDVTKVDLQLDKLEKTHSKNPTLSLDSSDQAARDKVIEANEAKFVNKSVDNVEHLYKCSKKSTVGEIKNCRKDHLNKNKKQ